MEDEIKQIICIQCGQPAFGVSIRNKIPILACARCFKIYDLDKGIPKLPPKTPQNLHSKPIETETEEESEYAIE